MTEFLVPSLLELIDEFVNAWKDYIAYLILIENIKISIFIIIVILVYIILWYPYLGNLSHKIWQTKGMLKMIPNEIIK